MEIRQLQLFLAIYKHRNITKAAEEFYVTQQTLSKQIKAFEDELGVPLFVRNARGVEPTEYAEGLVGPARQIVKTADHALHMLDEIRRQETVTVRLGLVRGDFNNYSAIPPKVIFQWEQAFPQMTLKVQEFDPDELKDMLLRDDLELACTLDDEEHPELCRIPIAVQPAYILVSNENPLAKQKFITEDMLRDQELLRPKASFSPEFVQDAFHSYLGFSPKFRTFNGTFDQIVERVRVNEGILLSSRSYCLSQNLEGISTFPLQNPDFVFRYFLTYRRGRELPAPVRQFIKECRSITTVDP